MPRYTYNLLVFLLLFVPLAKAQKVDTLQIKDSSVRVGIDTVSVKKFKHFPPFIDTTCKQGCKLRNQNARFGQKIGRAFALTFGYNTMITSLLLAMPEHISKWDKSNYAHQFKSAYAHPPVIDHDKWYINYVGHPYQGTMYYNSLRSQDANIWQSGLFCLGSVWMWEYTIEAGFEQPSIQDLIVTPGAGILLGELFHFSTLRMSRNGFKWYEKMAVSIINPTFALNNGFKYAGKPKPKLF